MADQGSVASREGLVRRRQGGESISSAQRDGQQMYQPGQPIGYLAARGTPYERKYFTRKLGFCCLFLAPPIILVTLVITLVPVLWAIANHALHTSQFHVEASNITAPGNSSFPLTLQAQVKKVGIFPAVIHFRKPIDVYWNTPPPNMREVKLGTFNLTRVNAAAGHAKVNQVTNFQISDEEAFGIFAGWLVSKEEFTWRINSTDLHVEAFSFFPTFKALDIQKDIVIKGINNFGNNVAILDLQLPGADPAGGIQVITTSLLNNPSPFGVQVGTLNLDLYFKGHYLGPVSANGLNITAGPNVVTLTGRVLPYPDNTTALNILGELFTNYINSVPSDVVAYGRSVTQANGEKVAWLSTGITELAAHVNFVPPEPIDPIKGISIRTINLEYSEETPYNPILSSQNLTGEFVLPFGFPLNITQLATSLSIIMDGAEIGSADGPFAPSNTVIDVLNQRQTAGEIDLSLPPSQLILPNSTDEAKKQLIEFQKAFVYTDGTGFQTKGKARTLTQTPLGEILLDGIMFNVSTGLKGLSGLTKYPTIINSVDVTGGTAQNIELGVALTVVNPSNLNLSTGDVTLQLIREDVVLGSTTLPDLHLLPGRNDINSSALFDPNVSPIGLETLNRFISGLDTVLDANGFNASSQIVSLAPALQDLRLNVSLPALNKALVNSANLTVLPTTGVTDDIANSIVGLANPFTSALGISRIEANASAKGIFLANINTALQFTAAGRNTTNSPNIPLALNLYPPDIFSVLRAFAVDSGQDPAYIDGLVQLAGITLSPAAESTTAAKRSIEEKRSNEQETFTFEEDSASVEAQMAALPNPGVFFDVSEEEYDASEEGTAVTKRALPLTSDTTLGKRANLYTGFDLREYVGKAFSVATADLSINADTTIGEYGSTLAFSQSNVPLGTDDSLFLLLPVLAKPIVQAIVDQSVLNIDRVTITEARPTGFTAALQGALTNAGPFDAVVNFPQGLDIYWQGQLLTQTAFPNITLTGDLGSQINVQLEGSIPDVGYFTNFLKSAITDPSFVWEIRGQNITVSALGIDVTGISLTKSVQLTGLNGLQGQVIINSFDLPANSPAGGIALTAISTINNPAQVGVALTQFGVDISMGDTMIGPSAAANAFTLQALAVNEVPLAGRIQQQTSEQGLADLSTLFTRFVHNQNTDLVVQGVYAGPSDVVWLNEGIKALRVNVALPSQDFQVIRVISLNSLALYFTVPTAWNPQTDSSNTTANFFLPFAFPVDITQVGGPFTANYENTDMAVLNIPASPATTDVEARVLTLAFSNVPFAVFGGAHQTFSQFAADFVAREMVTFNLHGSADSKLDTAAGTLSITDIPFDLNTNLLGLQGLNARPATVSNLDVFHGYPTYLQINVDTALFNPSDTTVGAGDVSFAVSFQDHIIGNALISNIILPPGSIEVPTSIQYMPIGADNVAAGQNLLENYVQNVTSEALVLGTSQTTPIESLVQALGQIQLKTSIPPLGQLLVQQATLVIPKNIAQNGGIASTQVTLNNPFTASISLLKLYALANFQDITIGTIDQNLAAANNIFFAPGHEVTTSNPIPITVDVRPKTLLRFILAAAEAYGVSLGPLPPFFQQVLDLPGEASTQVSPYPDDSVPPCNGGNAFDTLGAILALLKPLAVSIPIESTLKLDDYQTDLNFLQEPVPVKTDETALYLVGPAAAPLIQLIVDQATLKADRANATSLTNEGFVTSLIGSLLTDAPADAYIEAPDGLAVEYNGVHIANLTLPPLCTTVPDGIPNLSLTTQLTIINQGAFANFAYDLLVNPSFTWRLYSASVTVRTLGIKFSKVYLSKEITLDAFNGLPGIVITKFLTTGDGDDRINIVTDVDIPSQASLGVELGQATFDLRFQSTKIGEASSKDLFLAYKTTTSAELTGYLQDQHGNAQGIADLGVLFTQYLAGENSTLTIVGNNVISPASNGEPVGWLTTAFKRFSTQVTLPGMIYTIIKAITLSDLEVFLLEPENDFNVPATNQHTEAVFANPLVFSLQVLDLTPTITIVYENVNAALLTLPKIDAVSGVSTGPTDDESLNFGFEKQNVVALDHTAFQRFFAQLTDKESATFDLDGVTDVTARTVIGDIPIQRIPFNVTTSLKGINSFNNVATINSASVDSPTSEYIGANISASLENPSNLTVHVNSVSLPTWYKTSTNLGRSTIALLDLVPGTNTVPILFELVVPDNSTAAGQAVQEFLRLYVSSSTETSGGSANQLALQIRGTEPGGSVITNPELSPYESLALALGGTLADTTLTGLGSLVIKEIRVYLGPELIVAAIAPLFGDPILSGSQKFPPYVYSYIDFVNDLPSGLSFRQIYSNIFATGTTDEYATFVNNYNGNTRDGLSPYDADDLPPANANNEPSVAKTSVKASNILLTKGVLGSLTLLGKNLDVVNIIELYLFQKGQASSSGYYVPGLPYTQKNVPTTYLIGLGDDVGFPIPSLPTTLEEAIAILGQLPAAVSAAVFEALQEAANLGNGIAGLLSSSNKVSANALCSLGTTLDSILGSGASAACSSLTATTTSTTSTSASSTETSTATSTVTSTPTNTSTSTSSSSSSSSSSTA